MFGIAMYSLWVVTSCVCRISLCVVIDQSQSLITVENVLCETLVLYYISDADQLNCIDNDSS